MTAVASESPRGAAAHPRSIMRRAWLAISSARKRRARRCTTAESAPASRSMGYSCHRMGAGEAVQGRPAPRRRCARKLAVLATAVTALVAPATGSAHPSVYTGIGKVVTSPPNEPIVLDDQTRYVVSNHGHSYVMTESNLQLGQGVIDYKQLPEAFRETILTAVMLELGDTSVQAHHTCRTPELEEESAITGWQERDPVTDRREPAFGYVPFQKDSAGLGDDPDEWLPVVETLTGVDLATVSDDPVAARTELQTLCEGLPEPGIFVPADTLETSAADFSSATIAAATSQLNGQIDLLEATVESLNAQAAVLQGTLAAGNGGQVQAQGSLAAENQALKAEISKLKLEGTRLAIDSVSGRSVKLTGPAGKSVTIRMVMTKAKAKRLRLKSRVVAKATGRIGADAGATIPFKAKHKALKQGSLKVTVRARSKDRVASTRATLRR